MATPLDSKEVRSVVSHFRAGKPLAWRPLRRGSPDNPKALVRTDQGVFVLKRRSGDPFRVAFSHAVWQRVARCGVPVPELIGTRFSNNTMLQLDAGQNAPRTPGQPQQGQRTYELMRFVYGHRTDRSEASVESAARTQAAYHRALADFSCAWEPRRRAEPTPDWIEGVLRARAGADPDTIARLVARYATSVRARAFLGVDASPTQICHGDWHRGNLLFREGKVVAVLDHDLCRVAPVLADLACGALHFTQAPRPRAAQGGPPAPLDLPRLRLYLRTYSHQAGRSLIPTELRALPHLMIAQLVQEAANPAESAALLRTVERQTAWLEASAELIAGITG